METANAGLLSRRASPWFSVQNSPSHCEHPLGLAVSMEGHLPAVVRRSAPVRIWLCSLLLLCAALASQAFVRMFGHLTGSTLALHEVPPNCCPHVFFSWAQPLSGVFHPCGPDQGLPHPCMRGSCKPVPPVGPYMDTVTFLCAWYGVGCPITSFPRGFSHPGEGWPQGEK